MEGPSVQANNSPQQPQAAAEHPPLPFSSSSRLKASALGEQLWLQQLQADRKVRVWL